MIIENRIREKLSQQQIAKNALLFATHFFNLSLMRFYTSCLYFLIESTLESGIFEIPFDYHVHLGWFAAKDSSRENICKNHL